VRPDRRLRSGSRPSARTRDTLLDQVATKIGIDQSAFSSHNGFIQLSVIKALLICKAREHLGHENPQAPLSYTITPWVRVQGLSVFNSAKPEKPSELIEAAAHTTSTIEPVVLRPSRSAWARGASAKG
jgi:hypothetical protein